MFCPCSRPYHNPIEQRHIEMGSSDSHYCSVLAIADALLVSAAEMVSCAINTRPHLQTIHQNSENMINSDRARRTLHLRSSTGDTRHWHKVCVYLVAAITSAHCHRCVLSRFLDPRHCIAAALHLRTCARACLSYAYLVF